MTYRPRIADAELEAMLRASGAVLIEGPKACGKTETARRRAGSEVLLDVDLQDRAAAETDPLLLFDRATPILLDEWQLVPHLWDFVRREVDTRRTTGQFILTGSATPRDDSRRHSGAGRIAVLPMRTMCMAECGRSDASISLNELLSGATARSSSPGHSVSDIATFVTLGGWPGLIDEPFNVVMKNLRGYLRQVSHVEVPLISGSRRDPIKIAAFIASLARNTGTEAALSTLATDTQEFGMSVDRDSARDYLNALERLWIVEPQPAWSPALRSRIQLRKSAKWHLCDPSLAVAALHASPSKLLKDLRTLGFLFESLAIHDLRVLSQPLDAEVYHYRDNKGLEIDAVIECQDGRWGAFEVKLGSHRIDEAAANLLAFARKVDTRVIGEPGVLAVITARGPAYRRDDGVHVLPLGSLG